MINKKISIIIPTYNEKENIPDLIIQLNLLLKNYNFEIVVVDDNSPDKTGEIVDKLSEVYKNVKCVHRKSKLGLSSAVIEGFKKSHGQLLGVLDADFSHDINIIPRMINELKFNDIVIGSRYIELGNIQNWSFKRKLISKVGHLLSLHLTRVKDSMSGFFFLHKKVIKNVNLNSKGFKILLELLVKSNYNSVEEIPYTFTDRRLGKSKLSKKEYFDYLSNIINLTFYKYGCFIKFGLVGFSGLIVNLVVLYVLTEFLGIVYLISGCFSFIVSVIHNYILNKVFTFKEKLKEKFMVKGVKFFIISVIGFIINVSLLYIFTVRFGIYYMISQVIVIFIVFLFNYFMNRIFTFEK